MDFNLSSKPRGIYQGIKEREGKYDLYALAHTLHFHILLPNKSTKAESWNQVFSVSKDCHPQNIDLLVKCCAIDSQEYF